MNLTGVIDSIITKTNTNTTNKLDTTIIRNATSKTTPVDADELALLDSTSSFSLKKLTWSNLKATLGSLFAPLASPALTGTPTAPTATAGTNTTQIATTAFVKAKSELDSIGVNQTWQNMTSQRVAGATYTNTTGKPIEIHIFGGGNPTNTSITLFINGTVRVWSNPSYMANGGIAITAIIPNGTEYIINAYNGTFTLSVWSELR